jgi:hypothetical protein
MKLCLSMPAITAALVLALGSSATAQITTFIPSNDTTGMVYSTNSNDAYSGGRGDNFMVTANTTIDSVGLYENLTNITLNYEVGQIPALGGSGVDNGTVLRSGNRVVTTSGLEFIDFSFADLTLAAGNDYFVFFDFNGNSNQNFFYNNGNVTFTQGAFTMVDGFAPSANGQANFVMPDIRLTETAAVPEPGTYAMLVSFGLTAAGLLRRRRAR